MARKKAARSAPKSVETLTHDEASRPNIPTAEQQSLAELGEERAPRPPMRYSRVRPLEPGETRERNEDLDPQIVWNGVSLTLTPEQVEDLRQNKGRLELGDSQLVWRGKDTQDWTDLVVEVPPLYVQETINPKSLIDALKKDSAERGHETPDLFETLRVSEEADRTEFYQHEQGWTNRMILGDSLQVMASLAERERLRGKVQAIYFDPPYGIKFNSNWQVSTRSRDVKDGKMESMSREPEQVKAFRDTWKDGIHSYLTYLRDRLTVVRDLLTESGSIFVQIGDENLHRVRSLLDEVFGSDHFVCEIRFKTTGGHSSQYVASVFDSILWYRRGESTKFRRLFFDREPGKEGATQYKYGETARGERASISALAKDEQTIERVFQPYPMVSMGRSAKDEAVEYSGRLYRPTSGRHWSVRTGGTNRVVRAERVYPQGDNLRFVYYLDDYAVTPYTSIWTDTQTSGFGDERLFVVQTLPRVIERCLVMATDPGDLVLDPTCGSGTTATVAEQWGRRWITIDTSRVALALARQRMISARYPYYLLADSFDGQQKELSISGKAPAVESTSDDVCQGFVYGRVPHVTLKSIADNTEIDLIWERWEETLAPLREKLNSLLTASWEEWEVPRDLRRAAEKQKLTLTADSEKLHEDWWDARIARQQEIDESIARNADIELLYDRPYEDKRKVRVAGPFTVESLSPYRTVPMDDAEGVGVADGSGGRYKTLDNEQDFVTAILENLKTSGVQQGAKENRISFESVAPWPGEMVHAEGRFNDGGKERRAAICIGPEYGTLHRTDLTKAAREAADARFDMLVCCAFNYDPHVTDLQKLGPMPILKAKMNPDLHMAEELRRDKNANLFMVIGEPDVKVDEDGDELTVTVRGLDVFKPQTGELRAGGTDDIAAWFIDTDYDEECFFVRHAYFLGAGDPYKSLKTALKAEIDPEAWESLYSDVSRPFPRPESGRIAVKVIDHFGDEVMKVISV